MNLRNEQCADTNYKKWMPTELEVRNDTKQESDNNKLRHSYLIFANKQSVSIKDKLYSILKKWI